MCLRWVNAGMVVALGFLLQPASLPHLSLAGEGWLVDRRDRGTTSDLTAPEERGNTRTASSPRMLIGVLVRDGDSLFFFFFGTHFDLQFFFGSYNAILYTVMNGDAIGC